MSTNDATTAAAATTTVVSPATSSPVLAVSKEQLQELYMHKEFVGIWTDEQKRSPYRPNIVATVLEKIGDGKVIEKGTKKKVRAYIDGCYDIMHSGHYNAIRQAKSLCDELIVGVHSNVEIEHHKGPPVMNDDERLATVRACKWVDGVVFGVPYDPSVALLDELNCDFCVHGDDESTTADGKDAFAAVKAVGRMAIVKRTEGVSTTDLVKRLLAMTTTHHAPIHRPSAASPLTMAASAMANAAVEGMAEITLPPAHTGQPSASVVFSPPVTSPPALGTSSMSTFLPTTWRMSQFANHRVPKLGDRVVYIAGSFDLFHLGHIEKLEEAKKMGNFLYVGIYDDATVNSYKGKNYPVMNIHERVLNVLSCKFVDEVVIGAPFEITPDLIRTLNISVVAKVNPCASSLTRTSKRVPDPTGQLSSSLIQIVPIRSLLNTDTVIARILDNRVRYEQRNAKRAAKEEVYQTGKQYVQEK